MIHPSRKISLFLLFSFHISLVYCQLFLASKEPKQKMNFLDLQKTFQKWSAGKDLKTRKGWKFYKRWEYENVVRANGDGSIPDPGLLYTEAQKISQLKLSNKSYKTESSTWSPIGPVTLTSNDFGIGRVNCIAFHPSDSNIIFAGVAQGGVWKSTNGGNTWMPLTDNLPILRISDIAIDPIHPDTIYIAVGDYAYIGFGLDLNEKKRHSHYGLGVYKTTDGGNTWSPTGLAFNQTSFDSSLTSKILINLTNTDQIVAAGSSGIWKSNNAGQNWTHILDTLMWDLKKDPFRPNVLYASSGFLYSENIGYASVMKSYDFGSTWTVLNTGIPSQNAVQRIELAISPIDSNYIYALACDITGDTYGIYQSTDAGNTWAVKSTSNILGNGQGTYDMALMVDRVDKNKVYAGGLQIWGSKDGGITWDAVSPYFGTVHPDQHFFSYNPLNSKYYICNDGGVYTTNSIVIDTIPNTYSTQWTNISSGLAVTSFYRLGLSKNNPNYVIAGAQDNNSFYNKNGNWLNNIMGGDGMECMIDPNNPNTIYASSQYGYIGKSTDGGFNFNDISFPISEVGEWTTPYVLDPVDPATIYAGYGNLWKSTDGGNSWNTISNFSIISGFGYPDLTCALAVAPSNSNYIYLAKRVYHLYNQPGELWRTMDGGTNWQNITVGLPDSLYFTYIAVDDNDPNTAWVTCAGFYNGVKVFKTSNGGSSWTNISYNLPNIPVNCIVMHAGTVNNTVYIGTDLGVYYIKDNSTVWQFYSTGLPNVIVSELEIHASTNKLYAATFGRGIWMVDPLENVSVPENKFQAEILLYPNPNKGDFNLKISNQNADKISMEIADVTGKKVYNENMSISKNMFSKNYHLGLASGLYYMRLSSGNATKALRFVVN